MRVIAAINNASMPGLRCALVFDAPSVTKLEPAVGQDMPARTALRPCTAATATEVHAGDLTLDKFIDAATLTAAPTLPGRAPRCGRSC